MRIAMRWMLIVLALAGPAVGLQGCADRCSVLDRGYPLCGI
jgi:hypothetical protein